MLPVSSRPSLSTTRCVTESTLCHTTRCRGGTVAGFGENERTPSLPTTSIVIASADGTVVAGGLVDEYPPVPPHAATPRAAAAIAAAKQNLRITIVLSRAFQNRCRAALSGRPVRPETPHLRFQLTCSALTRLRHGPSSSDEASRSSDTRQVDRIDVRTARRCRARAT